MNPIRKQVLALVLLGAAGGAGAQSGAGLDGTWQATITKAGSQDGSAELVIKGAQGTWTGLARSSPSQKDSCIARPFPVIVAAQPGGGWRLSIEASTVAPGCKNRRATLKAVDAHTLIGELDSGHEVRLVRE